MWVGAWAGDALGGGGTWQVNVKAQCHSEWRQERHAYASYASSLCGGALESWLEWARRGTPEEMALAREHDVGKHRYNTDSQPQPADAECRAVDEYALHVARALRLVEPACDVG